MKTNFRASMISPVSGRRAARASRGPLPDWNVLIAGRIMRASKISDAIQILVGALFCLIGLAIVVWAFAAAPAGEQVWLLAGFGLVFAGFGCIPLYFVSRTRREQAKRNDLRALRPEEPWMLREDWAQGRAQSTTRSGMFGAWVFTIFWNAVSIPILFMQSEMVEEAGRTAYIGRLSRILAKNATMRDREGCSIVACLNMPRILQYSSVPSLGHL